MPELPETETIARDLHALITGAVIADVHVHRADVLRETTVEILRSIVVSLEVTRVWRRAKLVVVDLAAAETGDEREHDKWKLVVQPRFTGALLWDDGSLPADQRDYLTMTFQFSRGDSLHYRDVRRLGTVALMSRDRFSAYSGALGPEPLDEAFTSTQLSALVRASRRPVKAILMDQKRLAGVGNIYANEALWRAGIDPSREGASISIDEVHRLLIELRSILHASIAARGTSFRDYRDARGERGQFVQQLAVYGRGGEPCARCGRRLIETHAIDGRTTVFCAYCQR